MSELIPRRVLKKRHKMFLFDETEDELRALKELLEGNWDANGNCWEWRGRKNRDGYGQHEGYAVHRLSFALFNGNFLKAHVICHRCDNPKCYNPKHLFEGTQKDNMQDALSKGRMRKSISVYSRYK